ncbi:hypothetical protein JCM10296v2_005538 [Rhodotorula toruloides]
MASMAPQQAYHTAGLPQRPAGTASSTPASSSSRAPSSSPSTSSTSAPSSSTSSTSGQRSQPQQQGRGHTAAPRRPQRPIRRGIIHRITSDQTPYRTIALDGTTPAEAFADDYATLFEQGDEAHELVTGERLDRDESALYVVIGTARDLPDHWYIPGHFPGPVWTSSRAFFADCANLDTLVVIGAHGLCTNLTFLRQFLRDRLSHNCHLIFTLERSNRLPLTMTVAELIQGLNAGLDALDEDVAEVELDVDVAELLELLRGGQAARKLQSDGTRANGLQPLEKDADTLILASLVAPTKTAVAANVPASSDEEEDPFPSEQVTRKGKALSDLTRLPQRSAEFVRCDRNKCITVNTPEKIRAHRDVPDNEAGKFRNGYNCLGYCPKRCPLPDHTTQQRRVHTNANIPSCTCVRYKHVRARSRVSTARTSTKSGTRTAPSNPTGQEPHRNPLVTRAMALSMPVLPEERESLFYQGKKKKKS